MDVIKEKPKNTFIEIPAATLLDWELEAKEESMLAYNRVDSKFTDMYCKLKRETWIVANKILEIEQKAKSAKRDADKRIEEMEISIDRMSSQIAKHSKNKTL